METTYKYDRRELAQWLNIAYQRLDTTSCLDAMRSLLEKQNAISSDPTIIALTMQSDGDWVTEIVWMHHDGEIVECEVKERMINESVFRCAHQYIYFYRSILLDVHILEATGQ